MKVAFHSNQLCERGTEVALYKYAKYNEEILGNQSIIITPSTGDHSSFSKFNERFSVFLYNRNCNNFLDEIEQICESENVDVFYVIKSGEIDGVLPKNVKTAVHCVFKMFHPHGTVYAGVCKYISEKFGNIYPYVNHIIEKEMPNIIEDLRSELGIPESDLVLGRYGGKDTFNLPVYSTIEKALTERNDLWFIFLNTNKFIDHPRVIFLPMSIDEEYKAKFVNTCDGMIHARSDGETFGLAIAEFVVRNKPIITWNPKPCPAHYDTCHIYFLQESGIYYDTQQELFDILISLDKQYLNSNNWDNYTKNYTPEKVMKEFKDIFLS